MDNVAKFGCFKWKSKHSSSADYKKVGEKREGEKLLDGVELRGLWSLLATECPTQSSVNEMLFSFV